MRIGCTYRDDMDAARTVRPMSANGHNVLCRVFYSGKPVGQTTLPDTLFKDELPVDDQRSRRYERRIYLRLTEENA